MIGRRNALRLGVVASAVTLSGRGTARAADALTIGPNGVNIDYLDVARGVKAQSLTVSGPMKIDGNNALEFGAGVSGKEISAGQIAYQKHSTDALDIVGAGSTSGSRKIKCWAEGGATLYGSLTVSGDAILQQSLTVSGDAALSRSLTVTGDAALSKSLTGSLLTVTAPGDPNDLNKVSHLRLVRGNSDKTGGKKVFLELFQEDPKVEVAEVYPSIRFHHEGRSWHRLEARVDGLHLKTGNLAADNYTALTVGDLKATGAVNGEKPPYVFEIGNEADTTNWHAVQIPSEIIKSYLGDADGGTIKLLFRVNDSDEVRVITETVYIEQLDKSNHRTPGLRGWTRQLGGGESAFALGTAEKFDIIPHPWDWMWVRNYPTLPSGQSGADTRHAPGNAWTGNDGYKLEFLTRPNVSATVIIYDR